MRRRAAGVAWFALAGVAWAERITGPRPLRDIADRLEAAWRVPVTYEEPAWRNESDGSLDGDPLRLNVGPRERTADLPDAALTMRTRAQRAEVLRRIVAAFNSAHGPELAFEVRTPAWGFGIVAAKPGPVLLDETVEVARERRTAYFHLQALAGALSMNRAGVRVEAGTGVLGLGFDRLFGGLPFEWGTDGKVTAREALYSLLARRTSTTARLSWRLYCQPPAARATGFCVLNVDPMHGPEAPQVRAGGAMRWNGFEVQQMPEGIRFRRNVAGAAPPRVIELPPTSMPVMPPIAYMSYFGVVGGPCTEYGPEQGKCEEWFRESGELRTAIAKTLRRRFAWRDAAYVDDRDAAPFPELRPRETPRVSWLRPGGGFDLLIPWAAMPVQSDLPMRTLSVELDSAPVTVVLSQPRHFRFSPCGMPLAVDEDWIHTVIPRPAFFRPRPEDIVDTVFSWEMPLGERFWGPLGPSPVLRKVEATVIGPGPGGEFVCGPRLTWRRGADVLRGALTRGKLEHRWLNDGRVLVLDPPRVRSFRIDGSGMCGAAPVVEYEIYLITPGRAIETLKSVSRRLGCGDDPYVDMEVDISPTLDGVTEYLSTATGPRVEDDVWQACASVWNGNRFVDSPCVRASVPGRGRVGKQLERPRAQ